MSGAGAPRHLPKFHDFGIPPHGDGSRGRGRPGTRGIGPVTKLHKNLTATTGTTVV